MPTQPPFDRLPLRQRKHARTKLALLDATLAAIRTRPLEDVPVRDLCAAAGISEASFFNYFPRKAAVLTYFVQLWSVEMAWHAARFARTMGGLAAIEEVFAVTARDFATRPEPMAEVIAGQVRATSAPDFTEVGVAERLLRFPQLEGIESVEGRGLQDLLPPLVERAIALGELPRSVDRGAVLVALATIFLGLPVVLRRSPPAAMERAYREQLRLLWAGLRATTPE